MAKFRRLVTRAAFLILLGLVFTRIIRDRRDLSTQEFPVDFSALNRRSLTLPPAEPVRWFNGTHFGDRYRILRHLKGGNQGTVYLCADTQSDGKGEVVVKTISEHARNALPDYLRPAFANYTDHWPSEIDASLSLGPQSTTTESGYVPVLDYFITHNIGGTPKHPRWAWTLVTPFITGGTLVEFAHRLRRTGQTVEQLDQSYRGPFNHLLRDLHALHEQGYCHDDVKPQNIFIESPEHWLLGDLGNARNLEHGWHSTHLWHRRNQWSDCHLNDLRRALKSYLFFLREACDDADAFDYEFLHANNEWAGLYWDFVNHPQPQYQDALARRPITNATLSSGKQEGYRGTWVGEFTRRLLVDQELTCTSLWYKVWFTY